MDAMSKVSIYDGAQPDRDEPWFPNGRETKELIACTEACRNLQRLLKGLTPDDARGILLAVPPLVELVDHAVKLQGLLYKSETSRSGWPKNDVARFIELGSKLRKHQQGPLRRLRLKRAAHYDTDAFGRRPDVPSPTPDLLLPPLRDVLAFLILALNHENTYSWSRYPLGEKPDELEVIGSQVAVKLRVDPRSNAYNVLDREVRHPQMGLRGM